jgi:prepilin-type N-terminal cleavage/methylation domain-containing protein
MQPVPRVSHTVRGRSGYTLLEVLITLVIGAVVMGGALQLLDRQREASRVESIRVELQQNARYALDMMTRDLQEAGQGLDPTAQFGIIGMMDGASGQSDTLYLMYADPGTPVHTLENPTAPNKMRITKTCNDPVSDITVGDMMYIASGTGRGLARADKLVTSSTGLDCKTKQGKTGTVEVTFSLVDQGRHGWGFTGNVAGSAAAKVNAIAYYIDRSRPNNPRLMRANQHNNGTWSGVPVADNVSALQTVFVFQDGTVLTSANGTDANAENDFDDINTVQIELKTAARMTDKGLNKGNLYERTYTVSVSPRNQLYTRNL